ncbi:MAG: general secretion pathway protein M [Cellvibrionaceae bacterium]|jgi:general secretion pathway protein M
MEKVISWWEEHDQREQIMIAVGGFIAALILFFLFVISPTMNWHAQEKKRLEQAKADVSEVQILAARVQAKKRSGNGKKGGQSLALVIDKSIQENELVMRGFQPGSKKDARLRLENAPYPALAQWLYDLEYKHKVKIEDLSLTPSQLAGRLMVSLRVAE